MKKYELTNQVFEFNGKTLFRIRALRDFGDVKCGDFGDVKCGDFGGWLQFENNLSHEGESWVFGKAKVYDNAKVFGNAQVYENARVYGNAIVFSDAWVFGNAKVYGDAEVYENVKVFN
jgi:hypothetical protein